MTDGPSVQEDVWEAYQSTHPGEVQVLGAEVIGGNAAGTAEVFDPRAGTFTALPCHLSEPRSFHAAVRLLDGSILIAHKPEKTSFTHTNPLW